MKIRMFVRLIALLLGAFALSQCATPAGGIQVAPAATSAPVIQTVVVPATPQGASGVVKVLLVGMPEQDTLDPVTGKTAPGVDKLKALFEAAHPNIDMQITVIPWGSGST